MKYTKVALSYTVCTGTSGEYDDYRVDDVVFIRSDSDFLKREGGPNELMKLLTESSTRGGGIGPAQYDDIELTIHASKEYRKHPGDKESGASYYITSIDAESDTVAQAVHMYELKNRDVERNKESLEAARRDLERQINITAGLNRRYTSYEKMRGEQRKLDRIEARERILMSQDKPMREISSSEAWKELQKRKQAVNEKLAHMRENKRRYTSTLDVMKDELKTIKEAQKQVEREAREEQRLIEQRFKDLKKTQEKLERDYRFGLIERSPLLSLTDQQLREKVVEDRKRELDPALRDAYERERLEELRRQDEMRAKRLVDARNERDR